MECEINLEKIEMEIKKYCSVNGIPMLMLEGSDFIGEEWTYSDYNLKEKDKLAIIGSYHCNRSIDVKDLAKILDE